MGYILDPQGPSKFAPYGSVQILENPKAPKSHGLKPRPPHPNKRKTRMTRWMTRWMTRCIMVYPSFSDPHSSTRRNSGSCPCSATAAWLSSSEWHGAEMPSPSSLVGPQWGNGSGHPPGMQSISLGNQGKPRGTSISFHIYEACHRLVFLWTRNKQNMDHPLDTFGYQMLETWKSTWQI